MRKTAEKTDNTETDARLPFNYYKPVISDLIESLEDGKKILVEERPVSVITRDDFDYENPAIYD